MMTGMLGWYTYETYHAEQHNNDRCSCPGTLTPPPPHWWNNGGFDQWKKIANALIDRHHADDPAWGYATLGDRKNILAALLEVPWGEPDGMPWEHAIPALFLGRELNKTTLPHDPTFETHMAASPNIPVVVAYRLAHSLSVPARVRLAQNPNCPDQALGILARDPVPDVRYAVANNLKTSPGLRVTTSLSL